MRRPYDEDDDEEPWDADIDPEDMITNPSSTEIDMSLLEAQEDEFGDNEEEPSLDDFEDDTEPSGSSEGTDDEFGDDDEFRDNEEESPEEPATPAEDLDIPAVRTASLGRLRGKIPLPAPEEKPAEPEEDEFGDFEEEEPEESAEPAVPPARKRQAAARPQTPEAETAAAKASKPASEEPMYDNTGLGGFANALVGLFTRRRK